MSNENKQNDERAAFDDVKPLVDEWMRSRETCMDGAAYGAAIELAAFVAARATQQATTGEPEPSAAELEVAVETLRHVIDCLRKTGSSTDEEGEATDFLEPLLQVRATPSPVAGSAGQAAKGWKLVPNEPTREMCLAAKQKRATHPIRDDADSPVVLYRAMLAAAPTAPSLATDAGAVDQRHVGDSNFEGWYQEYATRLTGNPKQTARDAYAAGMGDTTEQRMSDAAREEQPSWTNPMTPYGMLVRALRIVVGTTLMDMATFLGCSPAQLSALEFGRKPVTNADIVNAAHYFASFGINSTTHALTMAARKAEIERQGGEA